MASQRRHGNNVYSEEIMKTFRDVEYIFFAGFSRRRRRERHVQTYQCCVVNAERKISLLGSYRDILTEFIKQSIVRKRNIKRLNFIIK
jgi:hypothetical protein